MPAGSDAIAAPSVTVTVSAAPAASVPPTCEAEPLGSRPMPFSVRAVHARAAGVLFVSV